MHKSQQQTVEIIQRPNRAGIEPVNELSFELERDGQAYGYTKQNSKGTRAHPHTHTLPRLLPAQTAPGASE